MEKLVSSLGDAYVKGQLNVNKGFSSPGVDIIGENVYGPTNTPAWIYRDGFSTPNTEIAPDKKLTASTYTFTNGTGYFSHDMYQTIYNINDGVEYTVSMWVKLKTATNFCIVVTDSYNWNTVAGKCFTVADGLSTSEWKKIYFSFIGTGITKINLYLGAHEEVITQQTSGTVAIWNLEVLTNTRIHLHNVAIDSLIMDNVYPNALLTYQKDTTTRNFTTTYADGFISAPFDVPAKSVVKVDFAIPMRNDSTSWGGGYTRVLYEINASGTWIDLGSSGFGGVMKLGNSSIDTYSNHFVLDFSSNLTPVSIRIAFRHKSYDGTLNVNWNHGIEDGATSSYAWTHLIVYTINGLTGPKGSQGETGTAASVMVGNVSAGDNPEDAQVINTGTSSSAILDFVLPKGDPGINVPDVSELTEMIEPDWGQDYVMVYDTSAEAQKKLDIRKLGVHSENSVKIDNLLAPNPFPTILHERGYTPLTSNDALNSRITTVNSAVNTQSYLHWSTLWNYHYMTYINPMTKTYAMPIPASTNYIIMEFPITVGVDNSLWINSAYGGWSEISGWLVHPTSSTIIKLLAYEVSNGDSTSVQGATVLPGPNGERDHPERYHHWHQFPISHIDVNLYKTENNTVRVAFTPGVNHSYAYMHISGLASSINSWGLTWMKGLHIGTWNPYGHNATMANYGAYEEGYMTQIAIGGTVNGIKIPILDTTSDLIIGFIKHKNVSYTGSTHWTISGTQLTYHESHSGKGYLAKYIDASNVSTGTRACHSIVIPQSVVAQYAQTDAKGFLYLLFNAYNASPVLTYYHVIYTEKYKDGGKLLAFKGDEGTAATIAVGDVTAGISPQDVSVVNVGTSNSAIFDFVIPKGEPGTTVPDMGQLPDLVDIDWEQDSLIVYDQSELAHKRARPDQMVRNVLTGAKKLIAETHSTGNGVLTFNNDVLTWGQKSGANVCALFDGAPTTNDTYQPGYLLQKPVGETGDLIDVDMWTHGGCALYSTGNFYTAGYNNNGGLGLGNTTSQSILVLSNTNVVEYARPLKVTIEWNAWRLFIKKTDGYWYGVGQNASGALGIGNTTQQNSWVQLTSLGTDVKKLYNLGTTYGCTIVEKEDGSIWAAGHNNNGQLGIGNTTNQTTFIDITANWGVLTTFGERVLDIQGGFGYSNPTTYNEGIIIMLISANGVTGRIRGAGYNAHGGPLGDGTTTQRTSPVAPLHDSNTIKSIHTAGGSPCSVYALESNGTMWVNGYNVYGQLGDGTTTGRTTPLLISFDSPIIKIFANAQSYLFGHQNQAFVQLEDGRIYGTGNNASGQLGDGTYTQRTTWTLIPYDFTKYGMMIDVKWNGSEANNMYITWLTDKGYVFGTGYNGRRGLSINTLHISNYSSLQRLDIGSIVNEGKKGDKGYTGLAATIEIGNVVSGDSPYDAGVVNTGTENYAVLDFTLPRGFNGDTPTIAVGEVEVGTTPEDASVTNVGTNINAVFDFVIPKAEKGDKGDEGDSSTISIGSVVSGDNPQDAQVINVGTPTSAIFNFVLPKGDPGTTVPNMDSLVFIDTIDWQNDGLLIYDKSALSHKKIRPNTIGRPALAGQTHVGYVKYNGLSTTVEASFNASSTAPTGTQRLNYNGYLYATRVYNAIWNDIADFIQVEEDCEIEFGYAYSYDGKKHHKTNKYGEKGIVGISSDTFGFGVGSKDNCKQIPIAIGGFVLAHCIEVYSSGTPLTSYSNGSLIKANIFTRLFHPEKIIGTFYKEEKEKVWNNDIQVNGRHWVKVK